jgi:thiol-disulfide isomerase/thioredoxin
MMALCLGLAGCQLFGKKSNSSSTTAPRPAGQPAPADRAVADSASSGLGGILAGQIIDGYGTKPPPTYIQVVATQPAKEAGAAPIVEKYEVVTDANGYYTIQNLQPGRRYQLIARAKDGGRKLAGMAWFTPPNPRAHIKISEDFVGKDIPDIPDTAGETPKSDKDQRSASPGKSKSPPAYIDRPIVIPSNPNAGLSPQSGPGTSSGIGVQLGAPVRGNGGLPAAPPPIITQHRESVVLGEDAEGTDMAKKRQPLPPANMNGSKPNEIATPPAILTGPAPVGSCSLTGRNLYNFALNDIDGKPWEFRNDRRGKLVLLDFWGTWCAYCVQSIPEMKVLQENYGHVGLEVIGIAYEKGSVEEQTKKVRSLAGRLATNYRLLLGTGRDVRCQVRSQFRVTEFPSYFLIDETGKIVWECRHALSERDMRELDQEIKRRLGVR